MNSFFVFLAGLWRGSERRLLFIVLSFLFIALGQPFISPLFAMFSASFAYAFFWLALVGIKKSRIFLFSLFWFAFIQAFQLFWMTAIDYQGVYIYPLFFLLSLCIGVQFAFLSFAIFSIEKMNWRNMCAIAGMWTLLEWGRLFIFTGFPWNPVAMALIANTYSLQLASLFGVYGMSFWVILTNLMAFRICFASFRRKLLLGYIFLIFFPYGYGFLHIFYHEFQMRENHYDSLSIALIHTAITPDEKWSVQGESSPYSSAYQTWLQVLELLKEKEVYHADLVVLPESMVAFGLEHVFYDKDLAVSKFKESLGEYVLSKLPKMERPFAKEYMYNGRFRYLVSNAFWAQTLCNCFVSDFIIGLDAKDKECGFTKNYNAAFHFKPFNGEYKRYEKQILIPGSEYMPFSWMSPLLKYYGIGGSFDPGRECKVFFSSKKNIPFSIAICSEEIYGNLVRRNRYIGAKFLVSLHNDVWFPNGKLALQHFNHGFVRTVENGFPMVRSTNVGVTSAIDSLGRIINVHESLWSDGVILVDFPLYNYKTFYTQWGDAPIVLVSLAFFLFFLFKLTFCV